MKLRSVVAMGGLIGGMVLGEYVQPYESVKNFVEFYNVPTAQGFPKDPWNYEVRREVEEIHGEKVQTLYLVNEAKGIHKKIDQEGCTCGVKNSLDDFLMESKNWFEEKIEATKEWLSEK